MMSNEKKRVVGSDCCATWTAVLCALMFSPPSPGQHVLNQRVGQVIDYASPSESFSDAHSSIGLMDRGFGGSGQLVVNHGRGRTVFDGDLFTLSFWVKDQKWKYYALNPQNVRSAYLPYAVQKSAQYRGWSAETELVFWDNNVVGLYVTLKNELAYPEVVKPVVRFHAAAMGERFAVTKTASGNSMRSRAEVPKPDTGPWVETFPLRVDPDSAAPKTLDRADHFSFSGFLSKTDKRDPETAFPIRIELKTGFPSDLVRYRSNEYPMEDALGSGNKETVDSVGLGMPAQILVAGPDMPVRGNGQVSLAFVFSVAIDEQTGQAGGPGVRELRVPAREAAEQKAAARWDAIWEVMDSRLSVPAKYRDLFAHCMYVLERNSVQFESKHFDRLTAQYPSKDHYNAHYNWDMCLQSLLTGCCRPKQAWEGLKILARNADASGKWPQFVCSSWNRPGPESQPPIASWAAWFLYQIAPDRQSLSELYPALVKNMQWWEHNRDTDRDGLYEWCGWLESGWDNSPRWDGWRKSGETLEAVDLNSYLVAGYHALSRMARVFDLKADENKWVRAAGALGRRMNARLYDPKRGMYFDRTVKTDTLSVLLTPASFFPFWAGVGQDGEKAKAAIRRWLLSEDHFWGEYGFPCVAFSEPAYEAGYYWRGANWLNLSYWMLCVLDKYGFTQERDRARERILNMALQNRPLMEYYNSKTGQGEGCPEYGWTASTIAMIVLNKYCWF